MQVIPRENITTKSTKDTKDTKWNLIIKDTLPKGYPPWNRGPLLHRGKSGRSSLWSTTGFETLWSIYFDCEILRDLRVLRGKQIL